MQERLQKIIAAAGLTSRRKAEEWIQAGQVTVNGQVVTELGSKADPDRDHIKVNGRLLRPSLQRLYLMLHKPKNCVTTVSDPQGRPTVMEYLRGVKERVYPVGRLDYHSEGLLLFTNDGEFSNAILTGRRIPKTYLVKINGLPEEAALEKFRQGIVLDGRQTLPARLRRVGREAANPWFEVTLVEGRQNQIRRMFQHLGFLVEKLKRVQIGFLELGALPPGKFRPLTDKEIRRFRRLAQKKP